MTRLLDADALKRALVTNGFRNDIDMMMTLETINNATTIEAEPVRHGKWIRRWTDPNKTAGIMIFLEQQCSECGCKFKDKPRDYKCCPSCGAKMDK